MAESSTLIVTHDVIRIKFNDPATQELLQRCKKNRIKTDYQGKYRTKQAKIRDKRVKGYEYEYQNNEIIAVEWIVPFPPGEETHYIQQLTLDGITYIPGLVLRP